MTDMLSLAGTGPVVLAVFVILIFFSVVSWAIIFYKLFQIHKANSESVRFMDFFWKTKRFDTIAAQADRFSSSPLVMLFNEGYSELKQVMDGDTKQEQAGVSTDLGDIENVTRALRRATNQEINRLEKYTTFLATTGSASPFIGLFGTVWGIMVAFEGIGRTGSASLAWWRPAFPEALAGHRHRPDRRHSGRHGLQPLPAQDPGAGQRDGQFFHRVPEHCPAQHHRQVGAARWQWDEETTNGAWLPRSTSLPWWT